MLGEALNAIEDLPANARRCRRVPGVQPLDDAKEVVVGWFGPADGCHGFGVMIRSNAATTVVWSTTRPARKAFLPFSTAARN